MDIVYAIHYIVILKYIAGALRSPSCRQTDKPGRYSHDTRPLNTIRLTTDEGRRKNVTPLQLVGIYNSIIYTHTHPYNKITVRFLWNLQGFHTSALLRRAVIYNILYYYTITFYIYAFRWLPSQVCIARSSSVYSKTMSTPASVPAAAAPAAVPSSRGPPRELATPNNNY